MHRMNPKLIDHTEWYGAIKRVVGAIGAIACIFWHVARICSDHRRRYRFTACDLRITSEWI